MLDNFLNIGCYDRIDTSLKAELVEKSINTAYGKSGKEVSKAIDLSAQTVMNTIRQSGDISNLAYKDSLEKKESEKAKVRYLYVEADEDHVALQNGRYA